MSTALKKKSNLELLDEAARLEYPLCGEVIDGELFVMGRPTFGHMNVEVEVMFDLRRGSGGPPPSGWTFIQEVEIRFTSTQEQAVPDICGWRTDRVAGHLDENPLTVVPDWVCEVLSESTRRKDLGKKRDLYARHGVAHLWIIDPDAHVLEAFALSGGKWTLQGTWTENAVVSGLEPFPEQSFEFARWWGSFGA